MKLKKYLPIIGIAIFAYLIYKLDIFNIVNEILNAKLIFLILAFLCVILSFFTTTAKWFAIARTQKMKIPFMEALKINFMSGFYGFVTPSRIGAIMRVEYLKRFDNDKFGKSISNYMLEKIIDLGSLLLLVIFSSIIFKNILSISYLYYAVAGLALFIFLLAVFSNEKRSKALLRIFYIKFIPARIKDKMKDGFHSFYEDMPEKKYFPLFLLLNIFNWIVLYSTFYFIGISVGINVSFFYFLLFMPITTFIGQIPITINGLGTREAAMISLFGFLGVPATKIFSMSLINLFMNGIFPSAIGMFLILRSRGKKSWTENNKPAF